MASPGARELGQDVADHVEDDNPHHLALHNHDSAPWVNSNTARVLQHICSKLPQELAILVEYLHLSSKSTSSKATIRVEMEETLTW